jgi:flagellar basal body-associated protein FliL
MENSQKKKKKISKKNLIIITVTSVVIIMLIAIILYLVFQKDKGDAKDTRPTVVTKDNVDDVIDSMNSTVKDGSYEVTMNTEWIFNKKSSNAYVENSTYNTRTVYFDVNLADSGKLVYSSPYIPVGEKIQGFSLDSKLKPGKYNAIVTYHLVDDNKKEVSKLSITVTFQIK